MGPLAPKSRIIAETPPNQNCFIGFHDIIPWSPDGSCLAIHRAAPELFRLEDCRKPIEICLWDPKSGAIQAVDSTMGWNFQQGSRLQWLPGSPDTLIFNTVENGRAIAVLKSVSKGERTVFRPRSMRSALTGRHRLRRTSLRWRIAGKLTGILAGRDSGPRTRMRTGCGSWILNRARKSVHFDEAGCGVRVCSRAQIPKAIFWLTPASVPMVREWSSCIGSSAPTGGSSPE